MENALQKRDAQTIKGPEDLFPTHESAALAVLAEAKAFEVKDADTYAAAGEKSKAVASEQRRIYADTDGYVKGLYEPYKLAVAYRDKVDKLREDARAILTAKRVAYAKAEAAKAEAIRLEAERVERERRDAEAAEQAAALEKQGRDAEAEAVIEHAVTAPVFTPKPAPPEKTVGLASVTTYKGLPRIGYNVPAEYCDLFPSQKKLNALAKEIGEGRVAAVGWMIVEKKEGERPTGR